MKAVFLSYASEDAAAARRIAGALRADGVEVWFDQSELVGGDAWDHRIRRQIRECALFAPVISANTQARGEGYFRLEWKLAVDRSHLMARDQTFFLPIVIDDTPCDEARVPEEFHAVQWTHLPGGETSAAFGARVHALLQGTTAPRIPSGSTHPAWRSNPPLPVEPGRSGAGAGGRRAWLAAAVVMLGGLVLFWLIRQRPGAAAAGLSAQVAGAGSEAQQLVVRARAQFQGNDDAYRGSFTIAEDLLKRAVRLDSVDGEVWAAYCQLSTDLYRYGYDRTPARLEALREQAERAIRLAPDSIEAQLAQGSAADYLGLDSAATVTRLRALAQRAPDNYRVWHALGRQLGRVGAVDEALQAFRRGDEVARTNPIPLTDATSYLLAAGRNAEAEVTVQEALARGVNGRALNWDLVLKLCWRGDLDAAAAALVKWPATYFHEDRGASLAGLVWMWRREPQKALAIYEEIPRDYLRDICFTGPRAALTALAHQQAGNREAAQADWAQAIVAANHELAVSPNSLDALYWKAWALAERGEKRSAEEIRQEIKQRRPTWTQPSFYSMEAKMAGLAIVLGDIDQALAFLSEELAPRAASAGLFKNGFVTFPLTRAILDTNPIFDRVRGDRRFRELVNRAPAPAGRRE